MPVEERNSVSPKTTGLSRRVRWGGGCWWVSKPTAKQLPPVEGAAPFSCRQEGAGGGSETQPREASSSLRENASGASRPCGGRSAQDASSRRRPWGCRLEKKVAADESLLPRDAGGSGDGRRSRERRGLFALGRGFDGEGIFSLREKEEGDIGEDFSDKRPVLLLLSRSTRGDPLASAGGLGDCRRRI